MSSDYVLDQSIQEINKKFKETEIGSKESISTINSKTAKQGYKEEKMVAEDLTNNKLLKKKFSPLLGDNYDECSKVTGNHKCDIESNNKNLRAQVKKIKEGQFQQLDRHWIDHLIANIPDLNKIETILKDVFEYPILPNETHIDRSKKLKKISTLYFSQETINNLFKVLNENIKHILNYAFLGTNSDMQPEYLIGVEYKNNKRNKIVIFKICDVINYLEQLKFEISPRETAILLGNEGIISLQRKGGDSGKKSSNQLQIKIIVSKLINKIYNIQYEL
jgi:hypothetical protein